MSDDEILIAERLMKADPSDLMLRHRWRLALVRGGRHVEAGLEPDDVIKVLGPVEHASIPSELQQVIAVHGDKIDVARVNYQDFVVALVGKVDRSQVVLVAPVWPACAECGGRGVVAATPGMGGDGTVECGSCGPEYRCTTCRDHGCERCI